MPGQFTLSDQRSRPRNRKFRDLTGRFDVLRRCNHRRQSAEDALQCCDLHIAEEIDWRRTQTFKVQIGECAPRRQLPGRNIRTYNSTTIIDLRMVRVPKYRSLPYIHVHAHPIERQPLDIKWLDVLLDAKNAKTQQSQQAGEKLLGFPISPSWVRRRKMNLTARPVHARNTEKYRKEWRNSQTPHCIYISLRSARRLFECAAVPGHG